LMAGVITRFRPSRPYFALGVNEPGYRTWRGNRAGSQPRWRRESHCRARRGTFFAGGQRGFLAEVDEGGAAVVGPEQEKPAPAEVTRDWMHTASQNRWPPRASTACRPWRRISRPASEARCGNRPTISVASADGAAAFREGSGLGGRWRIHRLRRPPGQTEQIESVKYGPQRAAGPATWAGNSATFHRIARESAEFGVCGQTFCIPGSQFIRLHHQARIPFAGATEQSDYNGWLPLKLRATGLLGGVDERPACKMTETAFIDWKYRSASHQAVLPTLGRGASNLAMSESGSHCHGHANTGVKLKTRR